MRPIHSYRRAVWACTLAPALLAGCQNGLTDALLEAEQPGIIDPSNVNSPEGADAIRLGTLINLRGITTAWTLGGLVGDEYVITVSASITGFVDQRRGSNPFAISAFTSVLRALASVRTSANQAIPLLAKWAPQNATTNVNIAEMYFARGMAELQIGRDFCSGIPLDDGNASPPVYTQPLSVQQILEVAVASFDTALARTTGTDNASLNINRAARIGKARALVGLGRFSEAAALVSTTTVPTTYTYNFTYATTSGNNPVWSLNGSGRSYSVGDSLEGPSRSIVVPYVVPFFSARDPRIPSSYTVSANGRDTTKGTDGVTNFRFTTLYGQTTPMALVNGIDARLVEAEARLAANDIPGMMTILNALRATTLTIGTVTVTPAQLPALAAPATRDAAINLLFREKAFWTYGRGQRLGDMRRLIRQYGRTQDKVYPTGLYPSGGSTYGTDVNFPLGPDENGNPNFKGCTDLNS
jgi:starch-binding outer membrane protein, SusD/RagB family